MTSSGGLQSDKAQAYLEEFILPRRHVDTIMLNKILVVTRTSDEESSVILHSLRQNGFSVTVSSDLKGHFKYDLIIVVISAGLDFGVAKRTVIPTLLIASQDEVAAVYPLLFTGRAEVDVLLKPVLPPLLLHKVENMIYSRVREQSYDLAVHHQLSKAWGCSVPTIPVVQLPEVAADVIESIQRWDFDMRYLSGLQYVVLLREMFCYFRLPELLNFELITLERLLLVIRDHYFLNEYHNFSHAFDVAQSAFCMLTTMHLEKYLAPLDIFIVLLATIGHDVEHPGCTNQHLIQSSSELAIRYHDRSCLENHHSYVLFSILQAPDCNVMRNFTAAQKKTARQQIIQAILGTDMVLHTQHVHNVQQRVSSCTDPKSSFLSKDNEHDRAFLVELLVHLSDLANIAKPFHLSKFWCENITVELFKLGAKERREGLTVSPGMDECETSCAKNMAVFIDGTCNTFFHGVMDLLPETKQFFSHIDLNRKKWQEILVEENVTNK